MNALAYVLLDAGVVEWWPIASGALGAVLAGTVLLVIKRTFSHKDTEQAQRDTEQAKRETAFNLRLDTLALRIETVDERSRSKDETLGYEIADTREQIAYYCGEKGLARPAFPKRSV